MPLSLDKPEVLEAFAKLDARVLDHITANSEEILGKKMTREVIAEGMYKSPVKPSAINPVVRLGWQTFPLDHSSTLGGVAMQYIDGAQIALYAFWIFFAGLIIYIRREDKREGYPLESPQGPRDGWPKSAGPKTFIHRPHSGEETH